MHATATPPCAPRAPVVRVTQLAASNPALQLAEEGWARIPGFIDAEDVAELRALVHAAIDHPDHAALLLRPPGCGQVLPDLFRLPAIYQRIFTPRLAALLAQLVGPGCVLLPEHAAHRNGYGNWHKDTDMFEAAGQQWHWSPDYAVYQCGIYLQDNGEQTGGGLSVVPGSHRLPRSAAQMQEVAARKGIALPSRAGDLVIFHSRLDHRATPRCVEPPCGDKKGDKLALFFMASRDNAHARAYSDFIHRRKDYTYLQGYRTPLDMQALARWHGVKFLD